VYFPEESVGRMKEFGRGCTVYLEGSYVVRDGSGALFRARSVHVTSAAPPLEQFRTGVRRKLTELADSAGGGAAWTGLSLALLFGIKDSLEGNLATSYRDAGCSHVLALSGMHLAIVSAMVVFLLKKPLGLRPAAVLGAIFVAAYVFVVGPQPSLVRAAIMYILGTLAVLGSLPRDPLNLLGMSFLIQIIADRASGTSLSFILSYLALFGILASGESLRRLCRGYLPDAALGPLAASVGAFIATAPVTAAWFGLLRPVGIPAGLVMVPLATAFMAGSALVLFLAGIFPPAGRIAGHVLAALYRIQEGIAGGAAALPGLRVPALPAAAAAIVLFILLLCLDRRVSRTRGRIAPFAQLS
jgi:competence protein ComEC